MATVTNWIDHLSASEVAGSVYPGVGTETILVIIAFVIWIGWHVITNMSESNDLEKLARKRHSANDHKSNITDW
jgi:hypothetical protein|tara:strand:- start:220 stop:441 length:222 start_codon:yes stop_codon:yes gene_type:complete